jgi:hypothetical protein
VRLIGIVEGNQVAGDKIKIVSIDDIDRLQQRPAAVAISELHECLSDLQPYMNELGKAYPGVVALAAIAGGEPHGVLVIAPSIKECYYSAGAAKAVRELALIASNLTGDLRSIFEVAWTKEKARRMKEDLRRAGVRRG